MTPLIFRIRTAILTGMILASSGVQLHSQTFQSFLTYVSSLPDSVRQSKVDSFLAVPRTYPIIEGTTAAHFLYSGNATTVTVPGDANGWNPNSFPMTRLQPTTLWYYSAQFESDARLDYKFVLNGGTWILDPRNPNQVNGGFGPNSELAMPDYVQPPEIRFTPGIQYGSLRDTTLNSTNLGNSRLIRIYTPPGYDGNSPVRYPVVLLHDGLEYITLGLAKNILDNLINQNRIVPVIGVFVPPVNRTQEYAQSQTALFTNFIVNEVMGMVDSLYRTRTDPGSRAMLGASYGGLISADICYNRPDVFGLAGLVSGSFAPKNEAVLQQILSGPKKNLRFYTDWGTYEQSIMQWGYRLRDSLLQKGYETKWREWHEGHSWGSWRAHLDEALEFFFPGIPVNVGNHNGTAPTEFGLSQNYPNPFNPKTVISYKLSVISIVILRIFDVLGREVATLVNEEQLAGVYQAEWDARVSSGVYFYRLEAVGADGKKFVQTKKMTLLR